MTTPDTTGIEEVMKQVESEYQMGGLSDGLYGDYAKEGFFKEDLLSLIANKSDINKDKE